MKEFPMENYKFIVHDNTVIAISHFAGKRIKGTAKCNPKDQFDLDIGKHLAAARCNLKVANKRNRRALQEYRQVMTEYSDITTKYHKKKKYLDDSYQKLLKAQEKLDKLMYSIYNVAAVSKNDATERHCEVCTDNRFELIQKYKDSLVDATNIESSPEEMSVIDNVLFRFWQIGWLDKLESLNNK